MSDRLISADALKKEWFEIDEEEWESRDIKRLIDKAPTALDVAEVCEEFNRIIHYIDDCLLIAQGNAEDGKPYENVDALYGKRIGLKFAIDRLSKRVGIAKKETPTVVAKNATGEHTCENCDNRESCDYHHYTDTDWKDYIGTECDEWKPTVAKNATVEEGGK